MRKTTASRLPSLNTWLIGLGMAAATWAAQSATLSTTPIAEYGIGVRVAHGASVRHEVWNLNCPVDVKTKTRACVIKRWLLANAVRPTQTLQHETGDQTLRMSPQPLAKASFEFVLVEPVGLTECKLTLRADHEAQELECLNTLASERYSLVAGGTALASLLGPEEFKTDKSFDAADASATASVFARETRPGSPPSTSFLRIECGRADGCTVHELTFAGKEVLINRYTTKGPSNEVSDVTFDAARKRYRFRLRNVRRVRECDFGPGGPANTVLACDTLPAFPGEKRGETTLRTIAESVPATEVVGPRVTNGVAKK